jgi:hypothetical protein
MSWFWSNWLRSAGSRVSEGKNRLGKTNPNRERRRSRVPARLHFEALERRDLLSGTWTLLNQAAPVNIGPLLILSDGTVMAQQAGVSQDWYQLTPDSSGSYINGTWSQRRSMSLQREYYASNTLPNGNVLIEGGEYSGSQGQQNLTNTGELYNPATNTWSSIANFPQANFGDDPTQMLPDGRILAGYIFGPQTYFYNPATNTWSFAANKYRNDRSDEETWAMLPDGSILSYDIFASQSQHTFLAERYIPSKNEWVDASRVDPNNPPGLLSDSNAYEIGPAVLLPDGRVFFLGANGSTGNTAYYVSATDTWEKGPILPYGCTGSDTPGALLPNGDVLFHAWNSTNDYVFELDPTTNTFADVTPSNYTFRPGNHPYMVVLPTGQILLGNDLSNQLDVFTPNGAPNSAWQPTITDITQNSSSLVTLTGTQLNGISEGALWGDDNEAYSNYPLVQLSEWHPRVGVTSSTYQRTFNWSSTGVATGALPETVQFNHDFTQGAGATLISVMGDGLASPSSWVYEMTRTHHNLVLRHDPVVLGDLDLLDNGSVVAVGPALDTDSVIVLGAPGTDNSLTVDYGGSPYAIPPVIFQGGSGGTNALTVTDAGDTHSGTWTVTDSSIVGTTSANLKISVAYHQVQSVELDTGAGGSTVSILGTGVPTLLNSNGTANTTVNVHATSAPLTINTGSYDAIYISGASNTLDPILGAVTVNDATGTSAVTVDDSGYGSSDNYRVTSSTVMIDRSSTFNLRYNGVGALTLNGSAGSDIFYIDSTSVSTIVNAGAGGNIIRISPVTQWLAASIVGPLTLNGGGDILEFFDANDPNSETFTFDPVPMSLTLGTTGTDICDFYGMGRGVYVVTNGFSTPDDQSGTVIFDPSGGPPSGQGDGPLAGSGPARQILVDFAGGDGRDLGVGRTTRDDMGVGLASWRAHVSDGAGADDYWTQVANSMNGEPALIASAGLDNLSGLDPNTQLVPIVL